MLWLCGKGDGNIRFFEFLDGALHFDGQFADSHPAKGYGFLPKTCLDVMKCEVMRALKLTTSTVETIKLIMPRKDPSF